MKFNKPKRKTVIIVVIILLIVGYLFVKPLFKNPLDAYRIEKIEKGLVLQEVSETGSVKATETINLSFKSTGRIDSINVNVGDSVKPGDILAKIDTNQLAIQLKDAKASLIVATSQYDKILNGSTPEDVKITEDARDSARQDLENAYDGALTSLDDAYVKIYNAYTTTDSIQMSYFTSFDQVGNMVQESKSNISGALTTVKTYLDKAKSSSNNSDVDLALSKTISSLNTVVSSLKVLRDACDDDSYYSRVSTTDKASVDTQRGYINTALASVSSEKQSIDAYKLALSKAESQLAFKKAAARPEDINLYKAQVAQAEARVDLLQQQISENYLRSPINGRITKINNDPGEVVAANSPLISLLSTNPFQIKVDIYEQDIVNVKVGNAVKINLVAFPKQIFLGKVLSVDPAEKIVDNVVYYEVTIDFDGNQEGIKSGMTADIIIETNRKENVVRIPKNAVEKIDSTEIVQVVAKGKIQNKEIKTDLEGNDYLEVVSGLSEGDQIITGKK